MHLDKSHISAHTYPDFESADGIVSFRVDIELSTCGTISPLNSLNAIFDFFDTDIVTIDYTVRGFTRSLEGKHIYMDHSFDTMCSFIDASILENYEHQELSLQSANIWQLKLLRTNRDENEYFSPKTALNAVERKEYMNILDQEMRSIFNG